MANEAHFSRDDTQVRHIDTSKQRSKSLKEKRLSSSLFRNVDNIVFEKNPSYHEIGRERTERGRNPNDNLPLLPRNPTELESVYEEVRDIVDASNDSCSTENEYDDTILDRSIMDENKPPPIPPKLRTRKPSQQNIITSQITHQDITDDEEGYVPVGHPDVTGGQALADSPADTEPSSSLSISEASALSIPSVTYTQVNSSEETYADPLDPFAYLAIEDDSQEFLSLGNLSSLEIPSPNIPNYNVDDILQLFHQAPKLSPIHSNDGSEISYDGDSTSPSHNRSSKSAQSKEPDDTLLEFQAENKPISSFCDRMVVHSDSGNNHEHNYDKLQWNHWRQNNDNKSKAVPVPSGQTFAHEIAESPQAEFNFDSALRRDPVEMQTFMLQKMQQALEAMQAAYVAITGRIIFNCPFHRIVTNAIYV